MQVDKYKALMQTENRWEIRHKLLFLPLYLAICVFLTWVSLNNSGWPYDLRGTVRQLFITNWIWLGGLSVVVFSVGLGVLIFLHRWIAYNKSKLRDIVYVVVAIIFAGALFIQGVAYTLSLMIVRNGDELFWFFSSLRISVIFEIGLGYVNFMSVAFLLAVIVFIFDLAWIDPAKASKRLKTKSRRNGA